MSPEILNAKFSEILETEESQTSILLNAYDEACKFLGEVLFDFKTSPSEDSKQMVIEASDTAIYALRELVKHFLNDEYVEHSNVRARMVTTLLADDVCRRDGLLGAQDPSTSNPDRPLFIEGKLASIIEYRIAERELSGDDYRTAADAIANDIVGRYYEETMIALDWFIQDTNVSE